MGCTKRVRMICRFRPLYKLWMNSPQNLGLMSVCTCIPMMISEQANSRKACLMPLAMFVARRTWVCILTSEALACFCSCSNRRKPCSREVLLRIPSYTTLRATSSLFKRWLRMVVARVSSCGAISGYFTQTSIRSSSSPMEMSLRRWVFSWMMICWEACSVISVLITQVKRIIITTPLSMISSIR